jgi:hypothetical protein
VVRKWFSLPIAGLSAWVWAVGLIPWIWIIPFNQYFWDDWLTAPLTGWDEQVLRWGGWGKHYLNPVIYFLVLPIGPWAFHVLMVLSITVTAVCLSRVTSHFRFIPNELAPWSGVFILLLPVFHARFAAAVIEYCLAMAALVLAWAILLEKRTWPWRLTSFLLLVFAIGVPSLAIIYPLIWLHIALGVEVRSDLSGFLRRGLRASPILLIPICYVPIFQLFVNTRSRYLSASGAITEFSRGLAIAVLVVGAALGYVWSYHQTMFRKWCWIAATGLFCYVAMFPYFAVGYNPLQDFLPWRIRKEVLDGLFASALLAIVTLLAVAVIVYWFFVRRKLGQFSFASMSLVLFSILFSAGMIVLGPMDWESRHWLVAWPALAVFIPTTLAVFRKTRWKSLLLFQLSIFFVASVAISSEYLVDSLKQKAMVREFHRTLLGQVPLVAVHGVTHVIVIETNQTSRRLDARRRGYPSYEWKGLLASGLGVSPKTLRVLNSKDLEREENQNCLEPFNAMLVEPTVVSSRLEALFQMRVDISVTAKPIQICSLVENDGW